MKKIFISFIFLLAHCLAFAADDSSVQFSLAGQIGVSSNFSTHFVNLGGPNVKAKYGIFALGLSLYPSVRLTELPGGNIAQPQLGFGPFFEIDHFVVSLPIYAKEGNDTAASFKNQQ